MAAALASADPEIYPALRVLESVALAPESMEAREVTDACMGISGWADAQHMPEIALYYAEAAAVVNPTNPMIAATAGQLCTRIRAETQGECIEVRAAAWYRRTIVLARRSKNWEWHTRAYLRLGILNYELGNYTAARRYYYKATSMGERNGLWPYAGQGQHGLLTLATDVGNYRKGEQCTRKALALYPANYDRLRHLAHDYAFLLIRHGVYGQASHLLDALMPLFPPQDRMRTILMGSRARCAAGLRNREQFERAATEVMILVEISEEGSATALLHIAEGARIFGEWDRAESYAASGLQIAMRRRETYTQRLAYGVLDRIMYRETSDFVAPLPMPARVKETAQLLLAALDKRYAPGEEPEAHRTTRATEVPVLTVAVP